MKNTLDLATSVMLFLVALAALVPVVRRLFSDKRRRRLIFKLSYELFVLALLGGALVFYFYGDLVWAVTFVALYTLMSVVSFLTSTRELDRGAIVFELLGPFFVFIILFVLAGLALVDTELRQLAEADEPVESASPAEVISGDAMPTSIIEENEPEVIQLP